MKFIMMLLGIGCVAVSSFFIEIDYNFYQLSMQTKANVIDYRITEGEEGLLYSPVIGFYSNQGDDVQFTTNWAASWREYSIGETVDIRYNMTNPYDAKLDTFFSLWGIGFVISSFGLFLVLISLKSMLSNKTKVPKQSFLSKLAYKYISKHDNKLSNDDVLKAFSNQYSNKD